MTNTWICLTMMSLAATLPPTMPISAAQAAERSTLVGKSYCFQDGHGTRQFVFRKQAGNKLLGTVSAFDPSNQRVWSFPIIGSPKPNAATATLDGDQLAVHFLSSTGTPGESDSFTIDLSSDTFQGTASAASGTGYTQYSRC